MTTESTTDRQVWSQARAAVLVAEKEATCARDALAEERRKLPGLVLEATYTFDTSNGTVSLAELFEGRPQLVVYHFMFGRDQEIGCPICSFWADSFDGIAPHLNARSTTFTCTSNAPLERLHDYRDRMGWSFPWASAGPSEFTADMGFSANQQRPDPLAPSSYEQPGLSVFTRSPDRDDQVVLNYQTTARGLEAFNAAYGILDLTPAGRDEAALSSTMSWVRRHNDYR